MLFEPGDVDALTGALRLYASDRDRRAGDGAASRARALERFSIPAMVRGYESVWRRVAGAAFSSMPSSVTSSGYFSRS